jgi:cytochrome c oxidase subunit II
VTGRTGGVSQSTLTPHSGPAHDIATLWWVMFVGAVVVFAVVTTLLLIGALRRRGEQRPAQSDSPFARRLVLYGGAIVPLIVLVALFALVLHTIPSTSAAEAKKGRLTIRVIGHQWFWEIRYPQSGVVTANELHMPAGVPVRIEARTADVIHSFWVPELNRKLDMIPGKRNDLLLETSRPGTYRGQCAEFCGLEHGLMAFSVVVQPRDRFQAWLAQQQQTAKGNDVFLSSGCGGCHTVRGTPADGTYAPDLTHVASRATLAAGTIANTPENLHRWIRSPQSIKPGNKMPALGLTPGDLDAVVAYLETLK